MAVAERGRRQIELVGGRLAWRAAARELGVGADWPLLPGPERVPLAPSGLTVSLTHKEDLAVALVGAEAQGLVGIDLEGDGRDRSAVASRVCRPEELAEVDALPREARWLSVMVRFAVKEAIYKAIAPQLGRFFGFQAARVDVSSREAVSVTMFLEPADPVFAIDAELWWLTEQRVLAMVRARKQ